MQIFLMLTIALFYNPVYAAADTSAGNSGGKVSVSKALVGDMLREALESGRSYPVALLNHFESDDIYAELPENLQEKKKWLTCLIDNSSAFDRQRVSPAWLDRTERMLAEFADRMKFEEWDKIRPASLDANPILCRQAAAALVLKWPKERFEQFAFNCIGGEKVHYHRSDDKNTKKIVRLPELLKVCLLTSQDPAICSLTGIDLSGVPLLECCLSKLFSEGKISGDELEALCLRPSEQEFNRLVSRLESSHEFKCAMAKGIIRHQLAARCATEQPRAACIYAIIAEMDMRLNRWEQQIKGMRPLKEAFSNDCAFEGSFLDAVYGYLRGAIEELLWHRSYSATSTELYKEMLRSAYLKHEISGQGSSYEVRNLLARMLIRPYYTRDFPVMPNEPLCPENPEDTRTLFHAALMGASDLPQPELLETDFFDFCCDIPDAVFDDIVEKLSQSPEVKEWYASVLQRPFGRKFHGQLGNLSNPEGKKRHYRFKRLIEAVEGQEALKKHLRAANLKSFNDQFCRWSLRQALSDDQSKSIIPDGLVASKWVETLRDGWLECDCRMCSRSAGRF